MCMSVHASLTREKANSDLIDYDAWGGGEAIITGTTELRTFTCSPPYEHKRPLLPLALTASGR